MCRSKGTDEGYFVVSTKVLSQLARKYLHPTTRKYFRPINGQPSRIVVLAPSPGHRFSLPGWPRLAEG
jgi:hypothetical protein